VLVAEVTPEGPAAAAGLRGGDVILEANRHVVQSAQECLEVLQSRDDDTILLLVARDDNTLYVALNQNAP
jgi:serine protease Do